MDAETSVERNDIYRKQLENAMSESLKTVKEESEEYFKQELEKALSLSKDNFENSRSILEKDLFDNLNMCNNNEEDVVDEEYVVDEARSNNNYQYWYPAYPLTLFPWYSDKYSNLENSNQVIMPQMILEELFPSNSYHQEEMNSPTFNNNNIIAFTLQITDIENESRKVVITPAEFIITDAVYLPNYIFQKLHIEPGNYICLKYVEHKIAVGIKAILSPDEPEFLNVKDLKTMLETSLISNYKCLKKNNKIKVFSKELNQDLTFTVKETEPENIIDITNTDLEVDFDINPDFFPKPEPIPINNASETNTTSTTSTEENESSTVDRGHRLGGDETESKVKETPEERRKRVREARLAWFM